jgi:hypothetical protein
MTDETDAIIRRLRRVADSLRRTEPAVAADVNAAIRLKQSSQEDRELARGRDPTLIARLESRVALATRENQSPLANDLSAAVELIRGL